MVAADLAVEEEEAAANGAILVGGAVETVRVEHPIAHVDPINDPKSIVDRCLSNRGSTSIKQYQRTQLFESPGLPPGLFFWWNTIVSGRLQTAARSQQAWAIHSET